MGKVRCTPENILNLASEFTVCANILDKIICTSLHNDCFDLDENTILPEEIEEVIKKLNDDIIEIKKILKVQSTYIRNGAEMLDKVGNMVYAPAECLMPLPFKG